MEEKKKKELNIIDSIYTDATYSAKYGLDILLTIIIIVVLISLIGYFSVLNNLQSLRSNWNEEKCNPLNFPFVPMINPDPNKTPNEQISDNINECVNDGLKDMTSGNLDDIYDQFGLFIGLKKYFDDFIKFIQNVFLWLFRTIAYIINLLLSILQKTYLGLIQILLKGQEMFNKMLGILVTNLFILLQVFNMAVAFVMNWATITSIVIITPLSISVAVLTSIIVVLTVITLALSALAFFFPPLEILVGIMWGLISSLIIALIATIVLLVIMAIVMGGLISIQNYAQKYMSGI